MKKAWEILKSPMTLRAKQLTDEIMVDGRERSVKEIITLMYKIVEGESNTTGRQSIPTKTELGSYLSRNGEYVSRIVRTGRKKTTFYERVID